jgi:hypothetical protein
MKRYRELSSRGNDAIPEKVSMLEIHKQKIQNEISRLMEVQKIIEYKLNHYHRKDNYHNIGLEIKKLALVTASFLYFIDNSKCSE